MSHFSYLCLLLTLCAVIVEINSLTGNTCGKKMSAPKGTNEWASVECKDNCCNYDVKAKLITKATLCAAELIPKYAKDPAGVMNEASKLSPKIYQCILDKIKYLDKENKGKIDKKKFKELYTIFVDKSTQKSFEVEMEKCVAANYDSLTSDYKSYSKFTSCSIKAYQKACPNSIDPEWYKKLTE